MSNQDRPTSPDKYAEQGHAELSRDILLVGQTDRAAFRRVYAASSDKLLGVCLTICRNRAVAEDLLQDSYLKVWKKAPSYDPSRSRPLAWLATIARNTSIDWYRSQTRHIHVGEDKLMFVGDEAEPADERIIRKERENEAFRHVSELDDDSEATLKQIYLQGCTVAQAAEEAGVPLSTMKSRVRRCVMKVRAKLAND